jgi:hypothetical protein
MFVHWNTLIYFGPKRFRFRPSIWVLATIPIHEMPKKHQELLIQIEDDLSMELTLPCCLQKGKFRPLWPTGSGAVPKMTKLIKDAL